jgi:Ca2+-binding EF-hand superfamily protein
VPYLPLCLTVVLFSPSPSHPQPPKAFAYFDKDNDAQLTVREMKDSVTAVFKERKNMAHSLKVRRCMAAVDGDLMMVMLVV